MLATVLFTDIVGSTEKAAELGDSRWRSLLDNHHAIIKRNLSRFRGHEIKRTGDGILATFDGPARGVRCACAAVCRCKKNRRSTQRKRLQNVGPAAYSRPGTQAGCRKRRASSSTCCELPFHAEASAFRARFNLLRFETGSQHDGHSPAEIPDGGAYRMPPQIASNP